jgi:hypothetical protein
LREEYVSFLFAARIIFESAGQPIRKNSRTVRHYLCPHTLHCLWHLPISRLTTVISADNGGKLRQIHMAIFQKSENTAKNGGEIMSN